MAVDTRRASDPLRPGSVRAVPLHSRELDEHGRVTLRYALDDEIAFDGGASSCRSAPRERADRGRAPARRRPARAAALGGGRELLQDRAARERRLRDAAAPPAPAAAALLEALYSRGPGRARLHERLPGLPRPSFVRSSQSESRSRLHARGRRVRLDPANAPLAACSCRSAAARTRRWRSRSSAARAGELRAVLDRRRAADRAHGRRSPACRTCSRRARSTRACRDLNAAGALNGHVPITAIVTCVALLTRGAERLRRGGDGQRALGVGGQREVGRRRGQPPVQQGAARRAAAERGAREQHARPTRGRALFSILRPASELAIARAFARMEAYHGAFTSCNAIFRIDPALRASVVVLRLPEVPLRVPGARAVQRSPQQLREVFGRDLLDDERQFDGLRAADRDAAGTSRSSASARSRRASRRSGCSRATRAGASTASCGGSRRRCCRRSPADVGDPDDGARAERRARGAGDAAGGRPCASRSLTARASACGAPAARSSRSPISSRAACRPRGSSWRRSTRSPRERRARRCARRRAHRRRAARPTLRAALSDCDVVVRSPGVSIHRPELRALREAGTARDDGDRRCGSPSAAARA